MSCARSVDRRVRSASVGRACRSRPYRSAPRATSALRPLMRSQAVPAECVSRAAGESSATQLVRWRGRHRATFHPTRACPGCRSRRRSRSSRPTAHHPRLAASAAECDEAGGAPPNRAASGIHPTTLHRPGISSGHAATPSRRWTPERDAFGLRHHRAHPDQLQNHHPAEEKEKSDLCKGAGDGNTLSAAAKIQCVALLSD